MEYNRNNAVCLVSTDDEVMGILEANVVEQNDIGWII